MEGVRRRMQLNGGRKKREKEMWRKKIINLIVEYLLKNDGK